MLKSEPMSSFRKRELKWRLVLAGTCSAGAVSVALFKPLRSAINHWTWIYLSFAALVVLLPLLFPNWARRFRRRNRQELEKEPSEQIGRWVP